MQIHFNTIGDFLHQILQELGKDAEEFTIDHYFIKIKESGKLSNEHSILQR
jgi:hypothetical protein